MPHAQSPVADIASTLAWWREAGVDCAFEDEAHGWLTPLPEEVAAAEAAEYARELAPAPQPEAPPPVRIGGEAASWPGDLAAFRDWWLSEPTLDGGAVRGRVPPRGVAGAALMVLVPEPEVEDAEELLSGPQGRLLAAMLAAMEIAPGDVYVASVLARHTPLADRAALAEQGIGELLAHHVGLVAPGRVIAFGGSIPPLLGHDPAQKTASLRLVNQEAASVPLLCAPELGHLAARPGAKAAFWRNWLGWTGNAGGSA